MRSARGHVNRHTCAVIVCDEAKAGLDTVASQTDKVGAIIAEEVAVVEESDVDVAELDELERRAARRVKLGMGWVGRVRVRFA